MGICKIFWDKPLHCVASFSIFSDSLKNIHGDRGWSFFVFRELQGQPTGKISLHHHLIIFSQVNAESGLFLFYLSSHPLLACYLLKYLTILYPRPFFIGLEPYLLYFSSMDGEMSEFDIWSHSLLFICWWSCETCETCYYVDRTF